RQPARRNSATCRERHVVLMAICFFRSGGTSMIRLRLVRGVRALVCGLATLGALPASPTAAPARSDVVAAARAPAPGASDAPVTLQAAGEPVVDLLPRLPPAG